MSPWLIAAAVLVAAVGSLVFSTLTYSLRELSRVRLADYLERRGMAKWLEPTTRHLTDLVFVTAFGRMLCNTSIVLASLWLFQMQFPARPATHYGGAALLATVVTLVCSVLVPDAVARHAGDTVVGMAVRPLHGLRVVLLPVTKLMHWMDRIAMRAVRANGADQPEQHGHEIQQEIMSVVEEGAKEGIVDEEQREMIESVIQFRDTTAGQIMTARPEIVAVEHTATLAELKQVLEESGHSRLPVYEKTLDHVVGVLYARDLLHFIGQPPDRFNMKSVVRPAYFVPEVKPLRDLLDDFRLQKVHIAIVLDEYGGTAGLVTIEDILEELVGDISDEHEPIEPAMFKRLDGDAAFEADARIYVDELNRLTGLDLPEDAGYDTLGGFVSTTLGRIPEKGATFEHGGAKFTVLEAEPQRVSRVRIDLLLQPAEAAAAPDAKVGGAA